MSLPFFSSQKYHSTEGRKHNFEVLKIWKCQKSKDSIQNNKIVSEN